jgi:hypothetical protein
MTVTETTQCVCLTKCYKKHIILASFVINGGGVGLGGTVGRVRVLAWLTQGTVKKPPAHRNLKDGIKKQKK